MKPPRGDRPLDPGPAPGPGTLRCLVCISRSKLRQKHGLQPLKVILCDAARQMKATIHVRMHDHRGEDRHQFHQNGIKNVVDAKIALVPFLDNIS